MEFIWFFTIVVLLFLVKSARFKGWFGEFIVKTKLNRLEGLGDGYRSLHNITLPTPDGTTQVDHIVLSPYGIFVIETKNMKGWIFGEYNQRTWTQIIYGNKYQFQNPIHQNYKHVKAIQSFLGVSQNEIISVIVFAGSCEFKTDVPEGVIFSGEIRRYIRSYDKKVFNDDQINKFVDALVNHKESFGHQSNQHINTLKRNLDNPSCPRCGKQMVVRSSRKANGYESKFWGCSGYPSCKSTKRI